MKNRNKYAFGVLTIVILCIIGWSTPWLASSREATWYIWTKTLGELFKVGRLTVTNNVDEQIRNLTAENVRLRHELYKLRHISRQLGTPYYDNYDVITADISARPLDHFHVQYLVNRGVNDGVVLGAPTVAEGTNLVGFITEVSESTSILQLLFHPQTDFPGEVLTDEGIGRGLVTGRAFTAVEITSVPSDIKLSIGQEVVTSGQESLVPPGLLVGKIERVENDAHDPFQRARIEITLDPENLQAVSILVAKK